MSYLSLAHSKRQSQIRRAVRAIREQNLDFDSIVCTGISGIIAAPTIAERLKKRLVIVRKDETSHGEQVESIGQINKYLIIDDFIETGETLNRIMEILEDYPYLNGKPVGAYLYAQQARGLFKDYQRRHKSLWIGG